MSKQTNKKYKLGLALSGGGARGFAHIGVFRFLEEYGLRPDIIAGTSAGALMGALYADGYKPDEITALFTEHEFFEFASMQIPKMGLFDSSKFHKYIKKVIRAKRFEDLRIPVIVMTTDLDRGKAHAFAKGEIADVITASCSVPIMFNPVNINGTHYVDGGLFTNFPVSAIRNECEIVIGSNVSPVVPEKYNKTIVGIAERSYHYLFRSNTEKDREICDILIETDEFGKYKMFDLKNVKLLTDIGYRAAANAFDECPSDSPIANLIKNYSSKVKKEHLTGNIVKMETNKPIIYQTFPRLFGNYNANPVKNGNMEENGCGKFNSYTKKALKEIKELGITHIWYTGIIAHSTCTDYTAYAIPKDHHAIVKGKAGSPYAIKDYYDVDPDLAEHVSDRMKEFEDLIERTHEAGMKVLIDFVPNHVARSYHSLEKPPYIDDLGQHDHTEQAFSTANNFYYIPGQRLELHFGAQEEDFEYSEFPAKVTGNDCFSATPGQNDWYETIKLNYGIDYTDGGTKHFSPIPDTWNKMLDILLFWTGKDIDGFRCDMAEMVPVEFWNWAIPRVKSRKNVLFIAEIYNPALYKDYIYTGRFDYLYDKVGMYDTLRNILRHKAPTIDITARWQAIEAFKEHMLFFLENHDEQRIASDYFVGDAQAGIPGLACIAMLDVNPVMIYNGQELGEKGMDDEGFSGTDGRTSIFDYWSMQSIRAWANNGLFDDGQLNNEQRMLRESYKKILNIVRNEKALSLGHFYGLAYCNKDNPYFPCEQMMAFLRKYENELIIVLINFDDKTYHFRVNLPKNAFDVLDIPDNTVSNVKELLSGEETICSLTYTCPYQDSITAYSTKILKFSY